MLAPLFPSGASFNCLSFSGPASSTEELSTKQTVTVMLNKQANKRLPAFRSRKGNPLSHLTGASVNSFPSWRQRRGSSSTGRRSKTVAYGTTKSLVGVSQPSLHRAASFSELQPEDIYHFVYK